MRGSMDWWRICAANSTATVLARSSPRNWLGSAFRERYARFIAQSYSSGVIRPLIHAVTLESITAAWIAELETQLGDEGASTEPSTPRPAPYAANVRRQRGTTRRRAWTSRHARWSISGARPARRSGSTATTRSTPKRVAHFLETHFHAARREHDDWMASAEGALALVLLLDQIPRNVFRGTAHAYATDSLARHYATRAVDAGFDTKVDPALRVFFYMPFEHSEELTDQQRSLAPASAASQAMTRTAGPCCTTTSSRASVASRIEMRRSGARAPARNGITSPVAALAADSISGTHELLFAQPLEQRRPVTRMHAGTVSSAGAERFGIPRPQPMRGVGQDFDPGLRTAFLQRGAQQRRAFGYRYIAVAIAVDREHGHADATQIRQRVEMPERRAARRRFGRQVFA